MKKKNRGQKINYYSDLLNDDFAYTHIKTNYIGKDFNFIKTSLIWQMLSWFFYYIIALPIIWVVSKLYLGVKIKNRTAIKKIRKSGFFIYSNHTRTLDVFIPPLVAFPSKVYTISSADAISIKGIRWLVMLLGCIPIPSNMGAMPNFSRAVEKRSAEKNCIAIFPEAHIWPFYTKIRPFKAVSFGYPVNFNLPVITATVTYRKRTGIFGFINKPGMTIFIGDPIYPNTMLPRSLRKEDLRNKVYNQMCKAAKKNEIEYIKYVKRTDS
ncbi:MAG: hypothetical protein DBX47_05345 [Clostridiales bacterium]|nr:MAG: hypothetical protein DBX47_05345 [Clostridiales bacterium]